MCSSFVTRACNVEMVMLRDIRLMVACFVLALTSFSVTNFDAFGAVEMSSSGEPYSE